MRGGIGIPKHQGNPQRKSDASGLSAEIPPVFESGRLAERDEEARARVPLVSRLAPAARSLREESTVANEQSGGNPHEAAPLLAVRPRPYSRVASGARRVAVSGQSKALRTRCRLPANGCPGRTHEATCSLLKGYTHPDTKQQKNIRHPAPRKNAEERREPGMRRSRQGPT